MPVLMKFHNCLAELFQDLIQLQEIWIAEGETCEHHQSKNSKFTIKPCEHFLGILGNVGKD